MDKSRQERYNLIYGNTARKMESSQAAPNYDEPLKKKRPKRRPSGPKTTTKTRQNQKRAMAIDFAFLKVLSAGLAVIAVMSFFYLSERARLLNQRAVLTDTKTQLNTLQVENEDLNLEIEQSIRLNTIEAAAKNYGMKKPDASHVIRYDSKNVEYVRQFGKIPKAD